MEGQVSVYKNTVYNKRTAPSETVTLGCGPQNPVFDGHSLLYTEHTQ